MLKENEQYFALIFHSALVYVPEGIREEELSLLNHSKVSEAHFLLVVHGVYLIEWKKFYRHFHVLFLRKLHLTKRLRYEFCTGNKFGLFCFPQILY
jgi:hypothetical protein